MIDLVEWIQLGGVFLAVGSLTFVLVALVLRRPEAEGKRRADGDEAKSSPRWWLGAATTALADTLPAPGRASSDLENELRSAGYYRPSALNEYRAVRYVLMLMAMLATGAAVLLAPSAYAGSVLIGGLVVVGLAYSLPRIFIAIRGRMRTQSIERGLPLAIDMLILCLSAGQNMLAALLQVASQLRQVNPALAQELAITYQQAELHSLAYALGQWATRVHRPAVETTVMVLIQSERLGADAVGTLSELAANFRTTARHRAEAQANRTNFWMLFPSVFCFWVAAAITLIGPAYLEYIQHQQRSAEMIRESSGRIRQFDSNKAKPAPNGPAAEAADIP